MAEVFNIDEDGKKLQLVKLATKFELKDKDHKDVKVHIEHLSCGHVNNVKKNGKDSEGICPKECLDVTVNKVELLGFDTYK